VALRRQRQLFQRRLRCRQRSLHPPATQPWMRSGGSGCARWRLC
jgi:hypothetical protein